MLPTTQASGAMPEAASVSGSAKSSGDDSCLQPSEAQSRPRGGPCLPEVLFPLAKMRTYGSRGYGKRLVYPEIAQPRRASRSAAGWTSDVAWGAPAAISVGADDFRECDPGGTNENDHHGREDEKHHGEEKPHSHPFRAFLSS